MRDKLPTILLALGFAVAGSGGTAIGYTVAQRNAQPAATAAPAAEAVDTAPPRARGRGMARAVRVKAEGGPRSKAATRSRGGERSRGARPGGPRGQGRSWASLTEDLEISTEQQEAFQQMMSDIRSGCVASRLEQGDTTFELIVDAVSQEEATTEQLHAQVESSLEARREASYCVLDEVLEFRAQLTPEQREALAERIASARERRRAWVEAWSD